MYAVIFQAEINKLDQPYREMAAHLRSIAKQKYGCIEFAALTEGNREITISYWEDEQQIAAWRQDSEHLKAQELGRSLWYKPYRVQVVKLEREYSGGADATGSIDDEFLS